MGNTSILGGSGVNPDPSLCIGVKRLSLRLGFRGRGIAEGEPSTGYTTPSVGLGCPYGEPVKFGLFGGGTYLIVAPSKRPESFGLLIRRRLLVGSGDSLTGDNCDSRAMSLS